MAGKKLLSLLILVAGTTAFSRYGLAEQLSGIGTVEYRMVHKFHKFTGVSKSMQIRGSVDASGLKVMARAMVSTFDSDNSNRDEHMMETVEGTKYPWVSVRAALPGFKLPASGATTVKVQAAVELHGVSVNHPIDIKLETHDGIHFKIGFEFDESLTAHKIERPSLMFVAVEDIIKIVGSAEVTAKP
jgi:hypothetical protein